MSFPEPCFDYEACLGACARGEQQALRELYEQESARLLGVAKRIASDNALAEDIVHDVFYQDLDPCRQFLYSERLCAGLDFQRNTASGAQLHA